MQPLRCRSLSCPTGGTYNARPGLGKYRTKICGEVQTTAGGYGSGNVWSAEVILNLTQGFQEVQSKQGVGTWIDLSD